jgi:small subunit ribosomal protein S1
MDFKVVKINPQQHNVVISHKALIEKDLEKQREQILNNLERGQVLEGTVKNITNFGVFIDLGGVDGLLHITDISWGRINSPEEVLSLDEKVNVVVLDFDEEKKRISLGLKQLQPHPWDNLPEDIDVGARVKGKIVTIADYGIFIEIMPGVEGLIHVSEMSWSQHPKNPYDLYEIGQEVEAVVLTLDREERKMSLGIKQLTEDPWLHAGDKYPVGSRHTGIVRNLTSYGCFVELEEGVDGLIHVGDLSWFKKVNHPSEFVQKDQELEVIVLELDQENRKLRLGHKQLTEDPWEKLEKIFPIDSMHQGTVTKMTDKGALVELEYGLEGFVPTKHLRVQEGEESIKEGDTVNLKVIEFNKEQKRILLSHTKVWKDESADESTSEEASAKKKASKKKKPTPTQRTERTAEKDTFGDLSELAQLKSQMEQSERSGSPAAPAATSTGASDEPVETAEAPASEEPSSETETSSENPEEEAAQTSGSETNNAATNEEEEKSE